MPIIRWHLPPRARLAGLLSDRVLRATATDGHAGATMRRLLVRIGELLGAAPSPQITGARKGSPAREPLSSQDRWRFRKMAEHRDIAESTDASCNAPDRR